MGLEQIIALKLTGTYGRRTVCRPRARIFSSRLDQIFSNLQIML